MHRNILVYELLGELLQQVKVDLDGGRVDDAKSKVVFLQGKLESMKERHDRLLNLKNLAQGLKG